MASCEQGQVMFLPRSPSTAYYNEGKEVNAYSWRLTLELSGRAAASAG
jgi:hypothetical protein